jgi:hypothetical protein
MTIDCGGGIAIVGHARSALLVAQDPDDELKRLLAIVKANRRHPGADGAFHAGPGRGGGRRRGRGLRAGEVVSHRGRQGRAIRPHPGAGGQGPVGGRILNS